MTKLNNLVNIENYQAGKYGNLLVSLDTDLCIKLNSNVEKSAVKLYIAGAEIQSKDAIDKFEEITDAETPANMVIVVSDKFMKLSNKKQIALLQYENIKLQELGEDHTLVEYAEVAAEAIVRKNFNWFNARVLEKAHNFKTSQVKKASRALAKQDKKDAKAEKKLQKANAKAAKKAAKSGSVDIEESIEVEPATEPNPA